MNPSHPKLKAVCVFCGSNCGARKEYALAAEEVGAELARRGLTLVYGGGNVGLMGIVADAALKVGGKVIGVIPEALMAKELGHTGLTKLHVVNSMHERKALMAELSDGFLALPGGFGTFEEFLEIVTWAQLGFHQKPCGLLNVAGFYDPFLQFIAHATREQFIRDEHTDTVIANESVPAVLDRMFAFKPAATHKWIDRDTL